MLVRGLDAGRPNLVVKIFSQLDVEPADEGNCTRLGTIRTQKLVENGFPNISA